MVSGNLFEPSKSIKAKRTKAGLKNPRFTTAVNHEAEAKLFRDDLKGQYKVLSQAQIKREYTVERIEDLLRRATANVKNMTMPSLRPPWMPVE